MSRRSNNGSANKLLAEDRPVHRWYRFVLSFPPHLVRDYVARFELGSDHCVLDPFCGTGTTLVECKKLGIPSVGVEANLMAYYASSVKTDWSIEPGALLRHARSVAERTRALVRSEKLPAEPRGGSGSVESVPANGRSVLKKYGFSLRVLDPAKAKLLLKDSISPLPLHRTLALVDEIERARRSSSYRHERLALARALVESIGNLHFGPEVGVAPPKGDAPVTAAWLQCIEAMAEDLRIVRSNGGAECTVYHGDSRGIGDLLAPQSVDAVITSPPYPNEKDYTRTTRLESVLLGFLGGMASLREMKQNLVRSNTRNVYKADTDDKWVDGHSEIDRIAKQIEQRRIALGKNSGFERLYHRVAKLYFGGMARHLSGLRKVLRPGARLAYVVGDQASYLRVKIRTGKLLAEIAEPLGYEVLGLDLFRTRLATATREQLREEVVCLRWPGARQSAS
jgi:SAM-dependent methyltransferase